MGERVATGGQLQAGGGNGPERTSVGSRAGHSVMTLNCRCVVAVTAAGEDFRVSTGPGN